jgi:hypothetical protein
MENGNMPQDLAKMKSKVTDFVTIEIRGRKIKVARATASPNPEGVRVLRSIFESAEAMRIRDSLRD